MKNTIHLTPETTVTYHYKNEPDELTVQLRPATGATRSEPLAEWEHIQLQREQISGEVVGFTITSVRQVALEQLVRTLVEKLEPHFAAVPIAESMPDKPEPVADTTGASEEGAAAATEGGEPQLSGAPSKSRSRSRRKTKQAPQPEAVEELAAIIDSSQDEQAGNAGATASDAPTEERARVTAVDEVSAPEEATPQAGELLARVEAGDLPAEDAIPDEAETAVQPSARKSRSRRRKVAAGASQTDDETESGRETKAETAERPAAEASPELVAEAAAKPNSRARGREKAEPDAGEAQAEARPVVAETSPAETGAEAVTAGANEGADVSIAEVSTDIQRSDEEAGVADSMVEESAAPNESGEPAEEAGDGEPASAEVGESSSRKRRRRRKRRNGSGSSVAAIASEATPEAPPAHERHAHYATVMPPRSDSAPAQRTRSAYKAEPIEGLDAPEEFQYLGLDPLVGQALHALGYESPTAIQRRAVPAAMEGRDIVGLAQTGTGKTMAFLLPTLHRMLKNPIDGHRPRLLVLTPTRELALQVATEAEYLATHTDFAIAAIYGQEDIKRQIRELREGLDVVVATPGRLLDHLQRGTIRLNAVEVLVLDEADRMLDMGFLPDVRKILNRLPAERQTMMFSATMPQAVQSLSLDFQRDPVMIEVARQLPPAQIEQKIYPVERHLKIPLLEHLLKQDPDMRSVMIFTETKAEADIVHRKLTEMGLNPVIMHGDISQRERERALGQLRSGAVRTLVATNVAARGLDIQDVTHVINYEVPQTVDDYVHRIGRTARGEGSEGTAITFMSSGDQGMIMRIESALERALPRVFAEGFNYDVPTPSWAKPSADDVAASLTKPKNLAERLGNMLRKR